MTLTEAQKKGLAIGHALVRVRGQGHPSFGRHWKKTQEQKDNVSRAKKGKKLSLEHRAALSRAKKGKPIPHLHTPEVREKIRKSLLGKPQPKMWNEKHHQWRGDKASYFAFHAWLQRKYGKADHCENPECVYPRKNAGNKILLKPKMFNWALIHGYEHGHNREAYMQLCCSCHRKYDAQKND